VVIQMAAEVEEAALLVHLRAAEVAEAASPVLLRLAEGSLRTVQRKLKHRGHYHCNHRLLSLLQADRQHQVNLIRLNRQDLPRLSILLCRVKSPQPMGILYQLQIKWALSLRKIRMEGEMVGPVQIKVAEASLRIRLFRVSHPESRGPMQLLCRLRIKRALNLQAIQTEEETVEHVQVKEAEVHREIRQLRDSHQDSPRQMLLLDQLRTKEAPSLQAVRSEEETVEHLQSKVVEAHRKTLQSRVKQRELQTNNLRCRWYRHRQEDHCQANLLRTNNLGFQVDLILRRRGSNRQ
jgi:hypothetical protein